MAILPADTDTTTTNLQWDVQATSLPSIPVIPAPMTGQLPLQDPLLVRGRTYCSTDFPWRAAVWFATEWQKRKVVVKAKKAHKTVAVPTRVQPARAAKTKRKREEEEEAVQKARHPAKRSKGYALDWPEGDMTIDICCECAGDGEDDETPAGIFQRMVVDVLVEAKMASGQHSQPSHQPHAYSLATLPLACTDMAFCLHGLDKVATNVDWPQAPKAPEAPMESCLSPVADEVQIHIRQDLESESQHVEQRAVEICGLRFAVDTCNGGTRVVMT